MQRHIAHMQLHQQLAVWRLSLSLTCEMLNWRAQQQQQQQQSSEHQ
jgi:hypothetical protein